MKKNLITLALAALATISAPVAAAEKGSMLQVELREIPANGRTELKDVPLGSGTSIVVMKILDEGTYRSGNKVDKGEDGRPVMEEEGILIEVKREGDVTRVRTEERTMTRTLPAIIDGKAITMPGYREVVSEGVVSDIGKEPILMGAYMTHSAKPMLRFYTIRRI